MARQPTHPPLNVYLNGRLLGRLRREPNGAVDFQYDKDWLGAQTAIPVSVSLPLREDRYSGAPVLAVFDNLLPDNDDIRRQLAERMQAGGTDAYNLLSAIGRDCVGALQFLPDDIAPGPAGSIEGQALSDTDVAKIINDLARKPLGMGDDREFRISLAGAQEKTALLHWNDKWYRPHGTTATTHILKPQIGKLPNGIDLSNSVENEHLCLQLVGALSLPVARSRIVDFDGTRVLAVERFDRQWTRDHRLLRVPQEDCCQALSIAPHRKYEADGGPGIRAISDLLKGSDTPEPDQRVFLKAQMAFWLLGAVDGHAKNFSIHLGVGGRFRLTPLYDIISVQPTLAAGGLRQNEMKMAMAVGDNRHYVVNTISGRHYLQTAKQCSLPEKMVRGLARELVESASAAKEAVVAQLPGDFPQAVLEPILLGLDQRVKSLEAMA